MRLPRRATPEAKAAAKEWEDLTGWYGVQGLGRNIELVVTIAQLDVLMDNWRAANNPKTTT